MNVIIIGNICSLCAMISDSISGTRKKNSEMLAVQIISQIFYGTGSFVLKGYSSVVQNVVGILRNIVGIIDIKNRFIEWSLIILGVVLGIVFNNRGLLGYLPIIGNLEYSVAIFRFKNNERALKLSFIINMVMFSIFNFVILNYVSGISNLITAITTAISLIKQQKETQKENLV